MQNTQLLLTIAVCFFSVEGRSTEEDFKCYRCELNSESPTPQRCSPTDLVTCTGSRPVCGKIDFSAFFHGVMGTRTLKFCYDMNRQQSGLPLEDIDLCDVAHSDMHTFSLETRSIFATVCANKHSTWHMSNTCTTSLCNGSIKLENITTLPILSICSLLILFQRYFI